MSQKDHNFQSALEQHLEALKAGKDPDEWMRDLLEWLLQEVLKLEFRQFLGAAPYERSQDRKGYRNGYYQRELYTRVGRLTLRVPRDRKGRFSTEIFERFQRSEKALVLALQESYLQGVSTRKVKKITEKLCGVQFSKDQVSSMAQQLDEELATWRTRPLEIAYPYLVVDAHYEYVREDGQVESDGVLLVKGIRADGYREILSVLVAPTEEEATWNEAFSDLIKRGLDAEAVKCITSDEHQGLRKAMRRYLPKATWQRCQTHYQRNAAGKVPAKAREEVHAGLRDIFNAPDAERAWQRAEWLKKGWRGRFPELVDWMEETLHDTLAVFSLPKEHRLRMRTNNGLERLHEEMRRRTRVVRIFPNRTSCLRLCTALSMEQSEEWLTGHRYLDMEVLEEEQPEPIELPKHEVVLA
jgi:transposase-like protein